MAQATRRDGCPPRRPGITLVEMCLALAVLGLVAASIATVFIAASDVVERDRGRTEMVQAGRAAMNRMLAELRTATAIEARSANSLRVYCQGTTWSGSLARRVEYWVADGTLWRQVEGEEAQALADRVTGLWTGGLTLWSKLGSSSDIAYPQVGPAGSITGTPYWTAVHFGTGFWSKRDSYCRAFFPAAGVLDNAQGTIEFWFRPEYSWQLIQRSVDKVLVETSSGSGHIELYYDESQQELVYRINADDSTRIEHLPTWGPDETVHVAMVWDCTGRQIGGGRTMALYINGVLCDDGAVIDTWTPQPFGAWLSLGDYEFCDAEAAYENLRVYDYCKTDFRDRYLQQAPCLMRVRLDLADEATGDTLSIESGVPVL
ncbi:MAG: hypothetical protein JW889_09880 [Verrucomicrobia bacterium]|nr:hypothetical protein [Verrucomicrobiota bacterium]